MARRGDEEQPESIDLQESFFLMEQNTGLGAGYGSMSRPRLRFAIHNCETEPVALRDEVVINPRTTRL